MKTIKTRILVVEDESIVAIDIKTRLIKLGYEVSRIIATSEDVISAAEELKPDLVLMDISLKGPMLGTEVAQKIQVMLNIPIIFLIAYSDDKTLDQSKRAELFGYITKPFDNVDLRLTIEIALYKANAEKKRKNLILKLQKASDEIKTLSGLIPVCVSCKKIRDDTGYWQAVEKYVEEHSSALFTHSICPDCIAKLSPGLDL